MEYKQKLLYKPNNRNKDGEILCGKCGKPGKGIIYDAVDLEDPSWRHYALHFDCNKPEYVGPMLEKILRY